MFISLIFPNKKRKLEANSIQLLQASTYTVGKLHSVYAIICVYVTGKIDNSDWTETRKISDSLYLQLFRIKFPILS